MGHDQAPAVHARLSVKDARTIAFYDAEAHAYAAQSKEAGRLKDFIAALPHGARVLDLGCGAGADSAALKNAGFDVVSVDASAGLAAEAKRLWNVEVRVLEFAQLDYVGAFDGVWASASLHHAPTETLPEIFARIRRALRASGHLHATLKADPVDRRDQLGRFFCAMHEEALATLVADWRDVRIERHQGGGYDGVATPWLWLRAVP